MTIWCKKSQFPAFCTIPYTVLYFTMYMVRNSIGINTVFHLITVPYRTTVHRTVHRTGTTLTLILELELGYYQGCKPLAEFAALWAPSVIFQMAIRWYTCQRAGLHTCLTLYLTCTCMYFFTSPLVSYLQTCVFYPAICCARFRPLQAQGPKLAGLFLVVCFGSCMVRELPIWWQIGVVFRTSWLACFWWWALGVAWCVSCWSGDEWGWSLRGCLVDRLLVQEKKVTCQFGYQSGWQSGWSFGGCLMDRLVVQVSHGLDTIQDVHSCRNWPQFCNTACAMWCSAWFLAEKGCWFNTACAMWCSAWCLWCCVVSNRKGILK